MNHEFTQFIIAGMQGLFFCMLLVFTLHAIFLAYHWFSYGTSKRISLIALAAYLLGGAVLLITYSLALTNL